MVDSDNDNGERDDRVNWPEIPDYALLRIIGRGGYGTVYLAKNTTTGHLRAVKVIPLKRHGRVDPAGREIMSLSRLESNLQRESPHLLRIHHVATTTTHLFYVMDAADDIKGGPPSVSAEYVPATLERRLQEGPLSSAVALEYARSLLQALAELHCAGMVHRDVKPSNCLFINGELKLADFGLLTDSGPDVSRLGTTTYMPPSGRMDARADVYAAGLVMYELVTGLPTERFPHVGGQAQSLLTDPVWRAMLRTALSACEPDPHTRCPHGQALSEELEANLSAQSHPQRRIMQGVAICCAALLAVTIPLCMYFLRTPCAVHVNFITVPYHEAAVLIDGVQQFRPDGLPYLTPCTIEGLSPQPHEVMFSLPEHPDLDAGTIDFAETRQLTATWPADGP